LWRCVAQRHTKLRTKPHTDQYCTKSPPKIFLIEKKSLTKN
jgi:hypothetical protein